MSKFELLKNNNAISGNNIREGKIEKVFGNELIHMFIVIAWVWKNISIPHPKGEENGPKSVENMRLQWHS